MNQRAGLTPDLTAGLTLLSVNPTATRCAWCNGPLVKPRRGKRFCSDSHRQMDNAARWAAAPLAVLTWVTGLMLSGVICDIPTATQIAEALEYVDGRRRRRFMESIGLVWVSEKRKWMRGE